MCALLVNVITIIIIVIMFQGFREGNQGLRNNVGAGRVSFRKLLEGGK